MENFDVQEARLEVVPLHLHTELAGYGHVQINIAEKPSVTPTTSVIFVGNKLYRALHNYLDVDGNCDSTQTHGLVYFLLPPCCLSDSEGYSTVRLYAVRLPSISLTLAVAVLLINAIAILSEDRFLARSMFAIATNVRAQMHSPARLGQHRTPCCAYHISDVQDTSSRTAR
jgi:hypothetical protein